METTAELESALAGTLFAGKLRHFAEIDSTNLQAMREVTAGAEHGTVYIADAQSAGRGRGAHTWHSEPGAGLYCSLLLRPAATLTSADALWLSLATGLAVQRAILEATRLSADIRWPNDLLLGEKKFCGILTELSAESGRVRHAVIGMGININHTAFPQELHALATSLRMESGQAWPRSVILSALLRAMQAELSVLLTPGSTEPAHVSILQRLRQHSTWIEGRRVHVDEAEGYTGVTAGLNAQGFLQVQTAIGLRTVLSGGVRSLNAEQTHAAGD
jgi:BirA family biotin operon repressor/biotin-[acetyl-CoA-carboxylase] ligase